MLFSSYNRVYIDFLRIFHLGNQDKSKISMGLVKVEGGGGGRWETGGAVLGVFWSCQKGIWHLRASKREGGSA